MHRLKIQVLNVCPADINSLPALTFAQQHLIPDYHPDFDMDPDQAWQKTLPGYMDHNYFNRPRVHAGFLKTWQSNQLDERVITRIRSLIDAGEVVESNLRCELFFLSFYFFFVGHKTT